MPSHFGGYHYLSMHLQLYQCETLWMSKSLKNENWNEWVQRTWRWPGPYFKGQSQNQVQQKWMHWYSGPTLQACHLHPWLDAVLTRKFCFLSLTFCIWTPPRSYYFWHHKSLLHTNRLSFFAPHYHTLFTPYLLLGQSNLISLTT